jgi:hypothetical protein
MSRLNRFNCKNINRISNLNEWVLIQMRRERIIRHRNLSKLKINSNNKFLLYDQSFLSFSKSGINFKNKLYSKL